jgi:hypothetical protein
MAAAPLQSVAVSAPPPAGDAASQIVYGAQAVSAINLTAFILIVDVIDFL